MRSSRRSQAGGAASAKRPFLPLPYVSFSHLGDDYVEKYGNEYASGSKGRGTMCYELTEEEKISDAKLVVVIDAYSGFGLSGTDARNYLNIPTDASCFVKPEDFPAGAVVFVSTRSGKHSLEKGRRMIIFFDKKLSVPRKRSADPYSLTVRYDALQGKSYAVTTMDNLVICKAEGGLHFFDRDSGQYLCQYGRTVSVTSREHFSNHYNNFIAEFPDLYFMHVIDNVIYVRLRTDDPTKLDAYRTGLNEPQEAKWLDIEPRSYVAAIQLNDISSPQLGATINVYDAGTFIGQIRHLLITSRGTLMMVTENGQFAEWDRNTRELLGYWLLDVGGSGNPGDVWWPTTDFAEPFLYVNDTMVVNVDTHEHYECEAVDEDCEVRRIKIVSVQDTDSHYNRTLLMGYEDDGTMKLVEWSAEKEDVGGTMQWREIQEVEQIGGPGDHRGPTGISVTDEKVYVNYAMYISIFSRTTWEQIAGWYHHEGDTNEMWDDGGIHVDAEGSVYVTTAAMEGDNSRRCVVKRFAP